MVGNVSSGVTSFDKNQKKDSVKNKGVGIGLVVAGLPKSTIFPKVSQTAMNNMFKTAQISPEQTQLVKDILVKTVESTGLKDKGVSVYNISSGDYSKLDEVYSFLKNKMVDKYFNFIKKVVPDDSFAESAEEMLKDVIAGQFIEGKNAAYAPNVKKVLIPDELALSGFHEIGHALNANSSKIGKVLQKCRGMSLLAVPILLISMFTKTKVSDVGKDNDASALEKSAGFVKKNAGKLTFVTFLPTLIEEGMATIKGNKLAKEALKDMPELLKKVKKTNLLGYSTYLAMATLTALGATAAVKVKDSIQEKYEQNKNLKSN